MTVDVTKVATDALVSLAAAAVPVLVAYVRRIALAHMSARELSLLSEIADVAVHAAEEAIGRGNGPAKLDFALQASSELAKHFGVKVSPAQLTDLSMQPSTTRGRGLAPSRTPHRWSPN